MTTLWILRQSFVKVAKHSEYHKDGFVDKQVKPASGNRVLQTERVERVLSTVVATIQAALPSAGNIPQKTFMPFHSIQVQVPFHRNREQLCSAGAAQLMAMAPHRYWPTATRDERSLHELR